MNKKQIIFLAIFVLLVISGIFFLAIFEKANVKEQKSEEKKLRVVTTVLPLYAFTKNIVGDKAEVENLLPAGAGCAHDYSFTPADVIKIFKADVVIKNGAHLDDWVDEIIESAGRGNLKVIDASEGIELLGVVESAKKPEEDEHAHSEEGNPHVWLDPLLAVKEVEKIGGGLMEADPGNKSVYLENSIAYIRKLRDLDKELELGLQDLKTKNFISFHAAFDYFAKRYGLNQVAVLEESPGKEPGAQYIANLINLIKKYKVPALFTEPQYSPKLMETLAADLKLPVFELDPLVTGEFTLDFYEKGMRKNTEILKEALGVKNEENNTEK
ncbi:MAG: metal ABC transporter substrate-binding protein [Patescibacteria group bacterium]|nr:metal ABC transporter substrate-binding protein [Patescibacteria group bacterium]MDD5490409.1 metal ABC transporter substrate-binding protein [Patescibacteria group bacterium]